MPHLSMIWCIITTQWSLLNQYPYLIVYIHVYTYSYIPIYINTSIYKYTCIYCVYTHTYTHTHKYIYQELDLREYHALTCSASIRKPSEALIWEANLCANHFTSLAKCQQLHANFLPLITTHVQIKFKYKSCQEPQMFRGG